MVQNVVADLPKRISSERRKKNYSADELVQSRRSEKRAVTAIVADDEQPRYDDAESYRSQQTNEEV